MNFINAMASVVGSTHYKLYYNNQDSYNFYQDTSCLIGVVADGCGSGSKSEVGASLAVDFVVNFCKKNFSNRPFDKNLLENALVEYLKNIVKNQQTDEELDFIENHLYFTLFGFIIQPTHTYVFHSGDGMYILNGQEVIVEQDNRPKYIAKTLISGNASLETNQIETSKLDRLLIATDGLFHLNEKFLKAENVAGMTGLNGFFDTENHFADLVSLPKFLTDLSLHKNILKDDTTMIMVKRR